MLVYKRERNQSLTIGSGTQAEQVIVTVLSIRGDTVRLAINADPRIPISKGAKP